MALALLGASFVLRRKRS
ncbi:MAG: hypothetical protein HN570_05375 [Verrucomicrobia bacterium]|nr:hypothetical protein [Verrucomicrobiota bacterium]MBT6165940.1 hypothetical protein [Verrucomicrobiota bacterium]MBT7215525.1 hypothetical protein [Verrucomicrobiota bacterium]MBT7970408.1 hypothetical protein [Verrucomicrobiota bacterium]